jgi:hypothetical protein
MTIENLDTPWAATPPAIAQPPRMTGVNVLPGYGSEQTASTKTEMSMPWSDQLEVPATPAVDSLGPMSLTE